MLNLNDVSLFVQVVDHRGFARAARALGTPKSTLSKRVAELERALGVRLIERTSRTFVVTDVGRDFYRHAAAMLVEAEAAESVVRGRLAEPRGTVRLTASVPTAQLSLAPILPELATAWPALRVVVHATDRFVDVVQEGFDLALRDHYAPLPDSELIQRRLGFDPSYLVASSAYLERRGGPPPAPAALEAHDGLLVALSETTWELRHPSGATAAIAPQPRFVADESVLLLQAARAGLGIACLPASLCRPHLEQGALLRVLPEWTARGVTTTLLLPPRRAVLPSVRTVADFLVARLFGG